jgi:hypothetical protein
MKWDKNRSIFVHIPKTGGTSIEVYFKDYLNEAFSKEEKHFTARDAKKLYPEWDIYFTFTFVRNPWERVFSYWYNYYNIFKQIERTKETFLNFLYQLHGDIEWQGNNVAKKHLLPQIDWITDEDGEICLQFIGRFECIQHDFDLIRDILHVDNEYALGNILWIPNKPHCSEFFDREHVELINEIYKKDIDQFGYRYENCSN